MAINRELSQFAGFVTIDESGNNNVGIATTVRISGGGGLFVGGVEVISPTGIWKGSSSGLIGSQGAQGAVGAQGAQGAVGAQGAQGAVGAQGAQGAVGAQGAQGATGTVGAQGAQGAQGAVGTQGAQGFQGAVGSQGAQGAVGTQGAQGAVGTQGAQGSPGSAGAQGAQGAVGSQGAQGAQGASGATVGGTANQVVYKNGSNVTSGDAGFTFNDSTNIIQLGNQHRFGLGDFTTTQRDAGIGTAVGTIIFNSTTSTLDVYISNAIGWGSIEISPDGTQSNPFGSPAQAQNSGATSGTSYYFKFGSMTSAIQAEYQGSYYESKPWIKVFQSAYTSTATVNLLGNSMPMKGLLVQRNALDYRAAVYWSSDQLYNSTSGGNNDSANSGYTPRRVILGGAGGHGIYNTSQNQCSWGDSSGAIGAGYDGGSCGSFPNNLVWGTGQSGNATYANRSGTWSHWIWWEGNN